MKNPYLLTWPILLLLLLVSQVRYSALAQDSEAPKSNSATKLAAEDPVLQNAEALQFVQAARAKLFTHETVQAEFTQRVALGDYRFQSHGRYISGEGFRSRIEYQVQLGELEGLFLEVCDGQILHTRRQIQKQRKGPAETAAPQLELSRRDIQKILRETQQHLDKPEAVRAAEIGIGGLPAILASLERTMIFESLEQRENNGTPITIVQARWNAAEKGKLLTGMGGMASQMDQFFPDRVRLTFNSETLFPLEFQYLKKITGEVATYKPILTVAFQKVVLNQSVSPQQFSYIPPPGMEERDETAVYIQAIQQAAAEDGKG